MLGSALAKKLVELGNTVTIFDLPNTNHPTLNNLKVKRISGDVCTLSDLKNACLGMDQVYHVCGVVSYFKVDKEKIMKVNYESVKDIIQVCGEKNIPLVVTASTAGVGIPKKPLTPMNELATFDKKYEKIAYMHSKNLALQAIKDAGKKGIKVCAVSPTSIYGAGDMCMHIGNDVKTIAEGKMKFAPPGGNSIVAVDDVVNAHILAMKKGKPGENYIIASENLTYLQIYHTIAKLLGKKDITKTCCKPCIYTRYFLSFIWETFLSIFGKKPKNPAFALRTKFKFRYFNASKAKKQLGWKPKVSFKDAMQQAIDFYREHELL